MSILCKSLYIKKIIFLYRKFHEKTKNKKQKTKKGVKIGNTERQYKER